VCCRCFSAVGALGGLASAAVSHVTWPAQGVSAGRLACPGAVVINGGPALGSDILDDDFTASMEEWMAEHMS
jgi:hypothetical protein